MRKVDKAVGELLSPTTGGILEQVLAKRRWSQVRVEDIFEFKDPSEDIFTQNYGQLDSIHRVSPQMHGEVSKELISSRNPVGLAPNKKRKSVLSG